MVVYYGVALGFYNKWLHDCRVHRKATDKRSCTNDSKRYHEHNKLYNFNNSERKIYTQFCKVIFCNTERASSPHGRINRIRMFLVAMLGTYAFVENLCRMGIRTRKTCFCVLI